MSTLGGGGGTSGSKSAIYAPSNFDVIMPDRKIVSEAFKVEMDCMEFRRSEHQNWDRFSKEFVFHVNEK